MSRTRRRPLLAAAGVLACAGLLAACGSDSGSSTSAAAASSSGGGSASRSPAHLTGGGKAREAGEEAGSRSGSGAPEGRVEAPARKRRHEAREHVARERRHYGSPSRQSAPFARYSGKSAQKGRPALHLAEFGQEATAGARQEVQGVVVAYLAAAAAGEWEAACTYLATEIKNRVEELTGRHGAGCRAALQTLDEASAGADVGKVGAPEEIASLRLQEGGRAGEGAGFALFHGSDGRSYWMPVKRQGGEWKVVGLAPTPFE